jgi:hypothetical protein
MRLLQKQHLHFFLFCIFTQHTPLSHISGTSYIKQAYPKSLLKRWEKSQQRKRPIAKLKKPQCQNCGYR